ncbi:hypothetical protein ACYZUC_00110 [Pseudomonas sp. GT1P32]
MSEHSGATEAGETLVTELERLVLQTASLADLVEEIRTTTLDFEQMVHASLRELDSEVSHAVQQATGWAHSAQTAVIELSKGLDTLSHDIRAQAVQLTRSVADEISQAIDQQARSVNDNEKLAGDAVKALDGELQTLISTLRTRLSEITQLWVEAHGANQAFHQQAMQMSQEFADQLAGAMDEARTAGDAFAAGLEQEVFVPVEQALAELDELMRSLGTRLFDEGLLSLGGTVEDAVRNEVSELINQAIDTIKQVVKEKIDEILEQRDRSDPERKALEAIFNTLQSLLGTLEEKLDAVKEIRAIVGT